MRSHSVYLLSTLFSLCLATHALADLPINECSGPGTDGATCYFHEDGSQGTCQNRVCVRAPEMEVALVPSFMLAAAWMARRNRRKAMLKRQQAGDSAGTATAV